MALTPTICVAQQRVPSTPEERAEFVRLAHTLEVDPLSDNAKAVRQRLRKWVNDVPDIHVPICSDLIGPVASSENNYGKEIADQIAISSAVFIIDNPALAQDYHAILFAGLKGALTAYEAIRAKEPNVKWSFLENLIKKNASGNLDSYVQNALTGKCFYYTRKPQYEAGDTVYRPNEVDRKAVIKKRGEPQYPAWASGSGLGGTVIIDVVLASSGRVTDITILQGLPYGLTELSVEAARKIQFEPAVKNGRPVSMFLRLEFNFHP